MADAFEGTVGVGAIGVEEIIADTEALGNTGEGVGEGKGEGIEELSNLIVRVAAKFPGGSMMFAGTVIVMS